MRVISYFVNAAQFDANNVDLELEARPLTSSRPVTLTLSTRGGRLSALLSAKEVRQLNEAVAMLRHGRADGEPHDEPMKCVALDWYMSETVMSILRDNLTIKVRPTPLQIYKDYGYVMRVNSDHGTVVVLLDDETLYKLDGRIQRILHPERLSTQEIVAGCSVTPKVLSK